MIRRLLFLVLALAAVAWWVRQRLSAQPRSNLFTGARQQPPDPTQGHMVRDRVCNTFLPQSRALSARVQGQQHFFCSEKCRDEFLSREEVPSA